MKEWVKENQFNSFNSWKGLLYQDHYKAIINKEFLPPIEASLDPIHACNLNCKHCNASRYLHNYDGRPQRMTDEHIMNLIGFLGEWGVKAICFGGGGEPTLHTKLSDALVHTSLKGMESSIATNGIAFTDKLIDASVLCRWIGISLDSATKETYLALKGVDMYDSVISSIKKLTAKNSDTDIAFKFLISSINQHEIYEACKLAKDLGVRDFHARPMDFRHQGMGADLSGKLANVNVEKIKEQMEKCHELETDSFRVFTVIHKFDKNFHPAKNFTNCYGAALCIQLCADGKVYYCVDQRRQPEYELGSHYPEPSRIKSYWGKEAHQKLIFGGTPSKCKTRCTFGVYCEQCEQLFTGADPMCRNFI